MAYEVSRLDNPQEQASLAEKIVTEKLTRDQAVAAVQARKPGQGTAKRTKQEFRQRRRYSDHYQRPGGGRRAGCDCRGFGVGVASGRRVLGEAGAGDQAA